MLIPWSGFCGRGFNPSVGILWGGTRLIATEERLSSLFQSLGRDSVGWDTSRSARSREGVNRFQSLGRDSVGWDLLSFLSFPFTGGRFQSLGRDSVGWDGIASPPSAPTRSVSIPRSGFCGVGPAMARLQPSSLDRFQSLGRDSVGWDPPGMEYHLGCGQVSIPRSGFCGVGPPPAGA